MAFVTLKIIVFEQYKKLINYALFIFFDYLLTIFNKESLRTTILAFEKAQMTLFCGQFMPLRLRQRFLTSFN